MEYKSYRHVGYSLENVYTARRNTYVFRLKYEKEIKLRVVQFKNFPRIIPDTLI